MYILNTLIVNRVVADDIQKEDILKLQIFVGLNWESVGFMINEIFV